MVDGSEAIVSVAYIVLMSGVTEICSFDFGVSVFGSDFICIYGVLIWVYIWSLGVMIVSPSG